MASLDQIREKLKKQEEQKSNSSNTDNQIYPFWNIPNNSQVLLRFLPDGDDNNTFFWRERLMIHLPFPGIKGHDEEKPTEVKVPCMEMYDKTCPILSEIRNWFNDSDLEPLARKYWKKYSYVYQGFVVEDKLGEENPPENPIRRFIINRSIHTIIKDSILDTDMEELPIDFDRGRDFKIKKTKNGDYASYTSSGWSQKNRSLSETERQAVKDHGLFNLSEFLPNQPNSESLNAIKELFKASVDGELYDPAKWGEFYKPYGVQINSNNDSTEEKTNKKSSMENLKKQVKNESNDDETEVSQDTQDESGENSAEDILNKIRNRKK